LRVFDVQFAVWREQVLAAIGHHEVVELTDNIFRCNSPYQP